ncbi:hypothetical protein ISG33_06560 [Glaciecola sp. MH2013]|uniref:hypothetical protein n=1 Tax=Glaciecola sp. MH2013 TaxID=2785524 RepID=UPI00189F8F9C|nr:hypothetical protein [Glaciecola sp. MH2013]MBF7073058.1 hypothetical protein [Glaciecola sp. MH2013]
MTKVQHNTRILKRLLLSFLVLVTFIWCIDVVLVSLNSTIAKETEYLKSPAELKPIHLPLATMLPSVASIDTVAPKASVKNSAIVKPEQKAEQQASAEKISQTRLQLEELDAKSVNLYFPRQAKQRKLLIEHLYECEGIAFATLKSIEEPNLMILAPKNAQIDFAATYSQWFRVVNEGLSGKEKNLLLTYAPDAIPIRLFPMRLDTALSAHIAQVLYSQSTKAGENIPLSQFSARYRLSAGSLLLVDIQVNHKSLSEKWLLSEKQCV